MHVRLVFLFALPVLLPVRIAAAAPLQTGDIIFQTSRSSQSLAVQQATHSAYSHMGVILVRNGRACVLEAVATVRCTPAEKWIARGVGRHYVVKRLKDGTVLTPDTTAKLEKAARTFEGRPYDLKFLWSDSRMYCSELVWKLFERVLGVRVGETEKLRDFDLSSAAVEAKIKERYGGTPPLDEIVISPQAIFDSPILEEVDRG